MKTLTLPVLLTIASLAAASCNKQAARTTDAAPATAAMPTTGYCLPASTAWATDDFTQWMTRAELQNFQAQAPKDQFFAHVEGRNNGGLNEYRAVRKLLPTEQYSEAAVFWSLDDKDLYQTELRLLRAGFVRKSMQVFIDASGTALHQLVWLKPLGAAAALAANAATATLPAPSLPEPEPPEPPTPNKKDAPANFVPLYAQVEPKPPVAVVVPANDQQAHPDTDAPNPRKFTTYTVVAGDILEKIAKRHHTTIEAIMAANSLSNDSLSIGQKLKIPKK
jgi:hypothetical protein